MDLNKICLEETCLIKFVHSKHGLYTLLRVAIQLDSYGSVYLTRMALHNMSF